jgi:hypothetical protein
LSICNLKITTDRINGNTGGIRELQFSIPTTPRLRQIFSGRSKSLDTVISTINNIHITTAVHRDARGSVELPVAGSLGTPLLDIAPV